MTLRVSFLLILSSLKLSRGLLVLPRPPSSPNDIQQSIYEGKIRDEKFYNEKLLPKIVSATNVEKPNTDDYKLLEIELRGRENAGGSNTLNFGEILREVFSNEELPIRSKAARDEINKLQSINEKISSLSKGTGNNVYPEKLYYLKKGKIIASDMVNHKRTSWKPRLYLKSIDAYDDNEDKKYVTKSLYRPKKYLKDINDRGDYNRPLLLNKKINYDINQNNYEIGYQTAEFHTTENSLPTSSELPKQIPPPPSKLPNLTIFAHTTPVLKYQYNISRRTDILPAVTNF